MFFLCLSLRQFELASSCLEILLALNYPRPDPDCQVRLSFSYLSNTTRLWEVNSLVFQPVRDGVVKCELCIMSFDSDLRVCQLCCLRPASQLCSCNGTLTYLCSLCLPLHQSSPAVHFLLSLKQNFVPTQQLKAERVKQGKTELWGNLERMDQCCREFVRSVDATVAMVEEYRDCMLEQLEGWKGQLRREIAAAIEQAEQPNEPASPLAKALLNYTPGSLLLFKYSIRTPDLQSDVNNWLKTELCGPCTASRVSLDPVAVLPNQLLQFSTSSLQWSTLLAFPKALPVDADSSVVEVEEDTWLVCGGRSLHQDSYLLNSAGCRRLNDMLEGRGLAGVIFESNTNAVYLFGGAGVIVPTLITCECFSFSSCVWTALPAMHHPRKGFNPCSDHSLIYLCGGPAVETFSPETECFEVLTFLPDLGTVVGVARDGEVLLVGAEVWRLEAKALDRVGEVRGVRTWSHSSAVLKANLLFFVDLHCAQGCVCIDFVGNQRVFPLP